MRPGIHRKRLGLSLAAWGLAVCVCVVEHRLAGTASAPEPVDHERTAEPSVARRAQIGIGTCTDTPVPAERELDESAGPPVDVPDALDASAGVCR